MCAESQTPESQRYSVPVISIYLHDSVVYGGVCREPESVLVSYNNYNLSRNTILIQYIHCLFIELLDIKRIQFVSTIVNATFFFIIKTRLPK